MNAKDSRKPKIANKPWIVLLITAVCIGLTIYTMYGARNFVERTHQRVESLARFLEAFDPTINCVQDPGFPTLNGLIVDDCHGDDGLFLGKALLYSETCQANSALLTVHYDSSAWFGACMYFYVYSNVPFNGTNTQVVFLQYTLMGSITLGQ